jgi:hypothetical protein
MKTLNYWNASTYNETEDCLIGDSAKNIELIENLEYLIDKAKELYPIGTEVCSLFGSGCVNKIKDHVSAPLSLLYNGKAWCINLNVVDLGDEGVTMWTVIKMSNDGAISYANKIVPPDVELKEPRVYTEEEVKILMKKVWDTAIARGYGEPDDIVEKLLKK